MAFIDAIFCLPMPCKVLLRLCWRHGKIRKHDRGIKISPTLDCSYNKIPMGSPRATSIPVAINAVMDVIARVLFIFICRFLNEKLSQQ